MKVFKLIFFFVFVVFESAIATSLEVGILVSPHFNDEDYSMFLGTKNYLKRSVECPPTLEYGFKVGLGFSKFHMISGFTINEYSCTFYELYDTNSDWSQTLHFRYFTTPLIFQYRGNFKGKGFGHYESIGCSFAYTFKTYKNHNIHDDFKPFVMFGNIEAGMHISIKKLKAMFGIGLRRTMYSPLEELPKWDTTKFRIKSLQISIGIYYEIFSK